jgi:hypothetical protein
VAAVDREGAIDVTVYHRVGNLAARQRLAHWSSLCPPTVFGLPLSVGGGLLSKHCRLPPIVLSPTRTTVLPLISALPLILFPNTSGIELLSSTVRLP